MPLSFPSSPTVGQTSTQNGRSYTYAGNNVWELTPGSGSEDVTLRAFFVPPPPTGVTATGGSSQATVLWTAPTVLAQTPITDYVVQYSSNSGSTWTTFSDGTSTATSATVTGLTNGTAYTFRVAAVNGVGQGAYSAASSAVTPGAGDPLFSSVSLLLHFEGSSLVDSSSNALTPLTLRENASTSTSQSRFGSKSLSLPASSGVSNALSAPSSAAFNWGTGDWCVEGWYYPTEHRDWSVLWHHGVAFSGSPTLYTNASGNLAVWANSTIIPDTSTGAALALNQWSFIAVSRSSGSVRLYVNGSLRGSGSYGGSINESSFHVGSYPHGGWNISMACHVDEFRVTKGFDRGYTGSSVTPPTAAFPDS